jgi:hypothetical protein
MEPASFHCLACSPDSTLPCRYQNQAFPDCLDQVHKKQKMMYKQTPRLMARKAVAGLLLILMQVSCTRDKITTAPAQNAPKTKRLLTINMDSDELVTSQIQSFYNEVKSIRAGTAVVKDYSPEDLNFLIEGAYNYLATTVSHDREEYTSFIIETEVPKNAAGNISAGNAFIAFYHLRDQLLTFEAGLSGSNKTLAHFNLELEDRPGSIVLKGIGDFATGVTESLGCDDSLGGPAGRGYLLMSGWVNNMPGSLYLKGQCDINIMAKTASNRVYNQQGAARMIIKYAMNKEKGCIKPAECGFYTEVSSSGWDTPLPIASPISQYAALGVSGGYTYNKKQLEIAESYLTPTISGDPDSVFKHWLTRRMVNFYIQRIPKYFESTIASSGDTGKVEIYTFDIEIGQYGPHLVVPAADNPGGTATDYVLNQRSYYLIHTAKFHKVPCPGNQKVGIGNL